MTFEEAKLDLERKKFFLIFKVATAFVIAINILIYLYLFITNGQLFSYTEQDLADLSLFSLSYSLPWWSNALFSFLWLFFAAWIFWLIKKKRFLWERKKICWRQAGFKKDGLDRADIERWLLVIHIYDFSLNYGANALGLAAAIFWKGALYGFIVSFGFVLYFHLLMICLILIWNIFFWVKKLFFLS